MYSPLHDGPDVWEDGVEGEDWPGRGLQLPAPHRNWNQAFMQINSLVSGKLGQIVQEWSTLTKFCYTNKIVNTTGAVK